MKLLQIFFMSMGALFVFNDYGMDRPQTNVQRLSDDIRNRDVNDLNTIPISDLDLFRDNLAQNVMEELMSRGCEGDFIRRLKYLIGIIKKADEIKAAEVIIRVISWIDRKAQSESLQWSHITARQYLNQALLPTPQPTTGEYLLRTYAITGTLAACIFIVYWSNH